jgi:hypothetical protein
MPGLDGVSRCKKLREDGSVVAARIVDIDVARLRRKLEAVVSPRPKTDAPKSATEHAWIAATVVLASVALAGLWGVASNAAGASAAGNVIKVPVLLVASALASLPTVLPRGSCSARPAPARPTCS